MSQRLAGANKLLLPLGERTVIERTVGAYLEARLAPILVVVGHEADEVRRVLAGLPIVFVENREYEQGQSRSLVRGVEAVGHDADAAVIGVGDQPLLRGELIRVMVETWETTNAPIVAPCFDGGRGNPVLFARSLFRELMTVRGDMGGRPVIRAHEERVQWVRSSAVDMAADVDTWEQYDFVQRQLERKS